MSRAESVPTSSGLPALYIGGLIATTALVYYVLDLVDENIIGHISNAEDSHEQSNVVSFGDYLRTNLNNFDPENDPDDFRKVVKLVIAAGLSAATLGAMYGMNEGTVSRWRDGTSVPSSVARKSIFNTIKEWLSLNK